MGASGTYRVWWSRDWENFKTSWTDRQYLDGRFGTEVGDNGGKSCTDGGID